MTRLRSDLTKGMSFRRVCSLYRLFDAEGVLLYVGITTHRVIAARWDQHRSDMPWWSDAASATIEHFPDVRTARKAEREAIRNEGPRYNVVHQKPARPPEEEVVYDF